MVDATTNDSIFRLLLEQSDQPDEVSAELAENLRLEWAEREALSRITSTDLFHEIMMDRWLSLAERGPVPIGREAIRSDHRLRTLISTSRAELERSFVLPGSEILYFPITGEVAGSFCELLFLGTMTTTTSPATITGETMGTLTLSSWLPGDVSVRITGNPYAADIVRLTSNARKWWTGTVIETTGIKGRSRKVIDWDWVLEIAQDVKASYAQDRRLTGTREGTVTDYKVWDAVQDDIQLSFDRFQKRLQEARREGKIPRGWP